MAADHPKTGIYSATYSGIPVYEFQFGPDLKEHVMRRREDNWINATHILKAAGFDKPARTRILERDVQKDVHEKIQGGYGKYQGTWIPLEHGEALAQRNNIYDRLRPIFEFRPGNESPPPAPRHASKPKAPKPRPAVPKWGSAAVHDDYDNTSQMNEDDTPDNVTVASASYIGEDDRYDMSHFSTGHRKRKREEMLQDMTEQQHAVYGDELLDYFLLSRNEQPAIRPDPPTNFQPDWPIDTERHTALHWASAMGDVDVIKQLKRFGANLASQNIRGETPFMRSVNFTNCYEKQTFPLVLRELFSTVDARDASGCTVIHHAAVMKSGRVTSHSCSRYYLDNILNKLQETRSADEMQQLLDAQDNDGNTAVHLAAMRDARKCIRALLGRGASTDIPNNQGVRAEDLIKELNASRPKAARGPPQRSSSPFAPESQRHNPFRDALAETDSKPKASFRSEAANTVQSRITPLVLQKFQDLAQSYENELDEKEEAEKEARRILLNTQAELANLRTSIADLESRLEADEAAAKTEAEAANTAEKVLAYLTHQNRIAVQDAVTKELAAVNGDATKDASTPHGQPSENLSSSNPDDPPNNNNTIIATKDRDQPRIETSSPEERLRLATELRALLQAQRRAEREYVEARGLTGTGDKIEKYLRLLKACLPPEDQDMLDENLEDMIKMMEDEAESLAGVPGAAGLGDGGAGEVGLRLSMPVEVGVAPL
ncbi:apses-domain-containing protein [Parathielavia appendiculata]|uniref:Apses-domain-containing protein n=1 Tax=Parathielavia appendiculata TaxID=2587402 RepID=A0AAN6TUZ1_9PEZI|nr:apses-domain-containing protein [Parathielavia appendiculata]